MANEIIQFVAEEIENTSMRDIIVVVRLDTLETGAKIRISKTSGEIVREDVNNPQYEPSTQRYTFRYTDFQFGESNDLICALSYQIDVYDIERPFSDVKNLTCVKDFTPEPPQWKCPDANLNASYDSESRSLTATVNVTVHDVPVTNACLYLSREGDATYPPEPLCSPGSYSTNFVLQGSKTIQNPGTYIIIFKHDRDSCGLTSQNVIVPTPEIPTEPTDGSTPSGEQPTDESHGRERPTNERHRIPFLPRLTLCSILEFLWTTGAIALIVGSFLAFASILGVGLSAIEVVSQPNTWYNWLLAGIIQVASAFLAGRWLELFTAWVIIFLSWFFICKPSYCRILEDWEWVFGWALVPLLIIEVMIIYLLQAESESGSGNFAIIISLVLLLLYIEAIRFIRGGLQQRINERGCRQLGTFEWPWNRQR